MQGISDLKLEANISIGADTRSSGPPNPLSGTLQPWSGQLESLGRPRARKNKRKPGKIKFLSFYSSISNLCSRVQVLHAAKS